MDNLGLSHITYAPGFTSETHPGGPATFTPDEWLQAFYRSYKFWVLDRVEQLIADPNAGFAILYMLYPYFQMVARYSNGRPGNGLEEFRLGMYKVFEAEFGSEPLPTREAITQWLYDNMRCELAHGNLTGKGISLSDDNTPAIWKHLNKEGIVDGVGVNPRLWYLRIQEHFEKYANDLHERANVDEFNNFLIYVKRHI